MEIEFLSEEEASESEHADDGDAEYVCSVCEKKCDSRTSLKEHETTHLKFKCQICDKAFYRERYLKRHNTCAHFKSKEATCPICGKFRLNKVLFRSFS